MATGKQDKIGTRSPFCNRAKVTLDCSKDESRTKQYFKEECDINNIVSRFQETGQVPHINNLEAQYGDAPDLDLKEALDLVQGFYAEYDALSPKLKEHFQNNPMNYAQAMHEFAEFKGTELYDSESLNTVNKDSEMVKKPSREESPKERSDKGGSEGEKD